MGTGYLKKSLSYFTKVSIENNKVKTNTKELELVSNSKKNKKIKKTFEKSEKTPNLSSVLPPLMSRFYLYSSPILFHFLSLLNLMLLYCKTQIELVRSPDRI